MQKWNSFWKIEKGYKIGFLEIQKPEQVKPYFPFLSLPFPFPFLLFLLFPWKPPFHHHFRLASTPTKLPRTDLANRRSEWVQGQPQTVPARPAAGPRAACRTRARATFPAQPYARSTLARLARALLGLSRPSSQHKPTQISLDQLRSSSNVGGQLVANPRPSLSLLPDSGYPNLSYHHVYANSRNT